MATALVGLLLLAGVLLPHWGEFLQYKQRFKCVSNCCLLSLDSRGSFCAPKTRKTMPCLPQTKGAINILCPCRGGLTCVSKDVNCARRCYLM
ncbi:PREDICTED: colipase-like protein 2 [Condylura cristata]|uniref:colipase-like protein 2 n=1 Tax=Condylura cristata TaxID=143302 RepID=UPI0003347694|nr:PREDICTED: colipase-like protein 2 [Condylura cristata]